MENRVKQLRHDILFTLVIIVMHLNISSSSPGEETTLYITPSSSIQCPAESCLTLSKLALNSSSWLSSNTTLFFLGGTHTLDTELFISSINTFFMLTNSTREGTHVVVCQNRASFNFDGAKELRIHGLKFIGCGSNKFSSIRNLTIENSTFHGQNDSETALDITKSNLTILNSTFIANRVGTCMKIFDVKAESNVSARIAGAILASNSNVNITNSNFLNNSAEIGGAMYINGLSNISIISSTFLSNEATSTHIQDCGMNYREIACSGGAIITFKSRLIVDGCIFINNTNLCGGGGAVSIQQKSVAEIRKSEFHGNGANGSGGALLIAILANVNIENSRFLMNSANSKGGVMFIALESEVTGRECVYERNSAKLSGGVTAMDQNSPFRDNSSIFYNNSAETGGVLFVVRSELTLNDSIFSHNQAKESGGVMHILQSHQDSEVVFYGRCNLTDNSAGTGGAIYAVESTLYVVNSAVISINLNTANDSGGGMYLYRSTLSHGYASVTNISGNKARTNGGGIHAINSMIISTQSYRKGSTWPFQTLTFFTSNSASKGGGLYLESGAQLRLQKVEDNVNLREDKLNASIYFTSNSAHYGSAVYVTDESYFGVCNGDCSIITRLSTVTSNAECFIQVFSKATSLLDKSSSVSIEFTTSKSDSFTGSTIIYGGLLDRCIPDPRAEIYAKGYIRNEVDGITYLKLISNINDTKNISSLPVRVCFCTPHNQPDCSDEPPITHVKKGESFNVSLVAVDQVNHTLNNIEIYSSLSYTESSLGEGQTTQVTRNGCTNLTFSITSPHASEELIFYTEGPCRNASRSQGRVHVAFLRCTCPIGFQPEKYNSSDCICICDSYLSPYFTEADNNCNIKTESLTRRGNFWISFINTTTSDDDSSDNSSKFLIYPYYPLDYCVPPNSDVLINLNILNGADAQCANNRSGLLCSLCQPGLSLSHGSSRCIPCSKAWYKGSVPVLAISAVVGIIIVVLLMALNLTVAVGTLNGLIFYANIIGINKSTFFSGLSLSTRYYSIFISWLNLEVGFDVCFFEGVDTYWKTWLQLVFPAYVIFLVAVVIIISNYSMKFSRLIAKRNPVATLATLILLSYTKFLQTTITALSFATLHYPDGSQKIVWLPDATVEYFSGKHIVLFAIAIIILFIGIAYTCIIFFWQWLIRYQDWTILKWTNSHRLAHFIEVYHAPYVSKHRYWTGLLLLTRIALYLVFALNVSGDPGVNLLAITTSVVSLLLLKGQFSRVYKSTFVDMTEIVCYANLFVFSIVGLKFETEEIVNITAGVSGVIILLLLVAIILHHAYATYCMKCVKKCQRQGERRLDDNDPLKDTTIDTLSPESVDCSEPTFSVVELELPGSDEQLIK